MENIIGFSFTLGLLILCIWAATKERNFEERAGLLFAAVILIIWLIWAFAANAAEKESALDNIFGEKTNIEKLLDEQPAEQLQEKPTLEQQREQFEKSLKDWKPESGRERDFFATLTAYSIIGAVIMLVYWVLDKWGKSKKTYRIKPKAPEKARPATEPKKRKK